MVSDFAAGMNIGLVFGFIMGVALSLIMKLLRKTYVIDAIQTIKGQAKK